MVYAVLRPNTEDRKEQQTTCLKGLSRAFHCLREQLDSRAARACSTPIAFYAEAATSKAYRVPQCGFGCVGGVFKMHITSRLPPCSDKLVFDQQSAALSTAGGKTSLSLN
ncbi:hypothetical protein BaRGS_00019031 [Batillaria attramentaria]|uniref:Uncharacterized protein n=1 Tax=Batillaria attramentaria TaxID=370345 RepID=A0ABD0KRN9_9CAEN